MWFKKKKAPPQTLILGDQFFAEYNPKLKSQPWVIYKTWLIVDSGDDPVLFYVSSFQDAAAMVHYLDGWVKVFGGSNAKIG